MRFIKPTRTEIRDFFIYIAVFAVVFFVAFSIRAAFGAWAAIASVAVALVVAVLLIRWEEPK